MHLLIWPSAAWHRRHLKTEREFLCAAAVLGCVAVVGTFFWTIHPAAAFVTIGAIAAYLGFGWLYDRTQP